MLRNIRYKFGNWFYLIPIWLVGFGVYINSLPNKFVWDDEEVIVNNLFVHSISNLSKVLTSTVFNTNGANPGAGYYRPLVPFLYILNYHWWGANPTGFRVFQILMHLVVLSLIFVVIRKILLMHNVSGASLLAFLIAIIFAVHPANVESVQYIANLSWVVTALLYLLIIWTFLLSINITKPTLKVGWFSLSILLIGLAMFVQEGAIIIAVLISLYFILYLRDRIIYLGIYWGALIFIMGAYLVMRLDVVGAGFSFVFSSPIGKAGLIERLITAPYTFWSYLSLAVFPARLTIDQQFVVSSVLNWRFGFAVFMIIIIGLLLYLFIRTQKNKMLLLFFLGWFVITIGPFLNILPLDLTIADHWIYFPLIGLIAFVGLATAENYHRFPVIIKSIMPHLMVFLIIILATRTMIRNLDWRDGLTLYGHDIVYNQNNRALENNLGVELFRVGKVSEATTHFENSVNIDPNWSTAVNNLGAMYERSGNLDKALVAYSKSISIDDYYLAYENKVGILIKMNKLDEAAQFLQITLQKYPHNSDFKYMLAALYYQKKDINSALFWLQSSLSDNPDNIQAKQLMQIIQPKGQ